jgi:hypothetical protein
VDDVENKNVKSLHCAGIDFTHFREYIDESSGLYYILAHENLEDDWIQYELILNFLSTNLPPPPSSTDVVVFSKVVRSCKTHRKIG